MKYLYQPFKARCLERIQVTFSQPTQVKLIKMEEFERYRKNRTYSYRGGFIKDSPVIFEVPADGVWYVVVEKGPHKKPIQLSAKAELLPRDLSTLNGTWQAETHHRVVEYDDTLE